MGRNVKTEINVFTIMILINYKNNKMRIISIKIYLADMGRNVKTEINMLTIMILINYKNNKMPDNLKFLNRVKILQLKRKLHKSLII